MTEDRGTVREEIAVLRNDVAWIKRAVLGLYGLAGALLIAFLASLASNHSVTQTAQAVLHVFA